MTKGARPPLAVVSLPENRSAGSLIREDELEKLTEAERKYYLARLSTSPPRSMKEAAEHLGISYGRSCAYWHEIRRKLGSDPLAFRKIRGGRPRSMSELEVMAKIAPGDFTRLMEARIDQLLRHMTESKMERASVGELARAVRELGQQRQLVRSEPQRSLNDRERENLNALMVELHREVQRRASAPDLNPETGASCTSPTPAGQIEEPTKLH